MSAARTLTDADVEAIADALERRFRPLRRRRLPPMPETRLPEADRRRVQDQTLSRIARAQAKATKR
jgi:hypothetical protein